jgi:hypothetical protein
VIAALRDDSIGCFLVTTRSGTRYRLDLDSRTVRRASAGPSPAFAQMRRDGDEVRLIELVECVVGSPMILLVDLHIPNVVMTRRRSTDVHEIAAWDFGDTK